MRIKRVSVSRNSIVVRKLRDQKLRNGIPFMINVKELSSHQCYLEYPDGVIKLVSVVSTSREINVVKVLNTSDANSLRKRLNFSK